MTFQKSAVTWYSCGTGSSRDTNLASHSAPCSCPRSMAVVVSAETLMQLAVSPLGLKTNRLGKEHQVWKANKRRYQLSVLAAGVCWAGTLYTTARDMQRDSSSHHSWSQASAYPLPSSTTSQHARPEQSQVSFSASPQLVPGHAIAAVQHRLVPEHAEAAGGRGALGMNRKQRPVAPEGVGKVPRNRGCVLASAKCGRRGKHSAWLYHPPWLLDTAQLSACSLCQERCHHLCRQQQQQQGQLRRRRQQQERAPAAAGCDKSSSPGVAQEAGQARGRKHGRQHIGLHGMDCTVQSADTSAFAGWCCGIASAWYVHTFLLGHSTHSQSVHLLPALIATQRARHAIAHCAGTCATAHHAYAIAHSTHPQPMHHLVCEGVHHPGSAAIERGLGGVQLGDAHAHPPADCEHERKATVLGWARREEGFEEPAWLRLKRAADCNQIGEQCRAWPMWHSAWAAQCGSRRSLQGGTQPPKLCAVAQNSPAAHPGSRCCWAGWRTVRPAGQAGKQDWKSSVRHWFGSLRPTRCRRL